MLCLTIPNGTPNEVHELQKVGGAVTRPIVADLSQLTDMLPLSRAVYVDKDTTAPSALRDGSIAFPYATIQDACDALSGTGGVVLIVPGVYTEPAINISGGQISLVGLGPRSQGSNANVTINNSVSSVADLGAFNISFTNALTSTGRIFADTCSITNFSAGTGVSILQNCTVTNCTCTGTLQTFSCSITNTPSLAVVDSQQTIWQAGPFSCTGNLTARGSTFTNGVSCGGSATVRGCSISTFITVTFALSTDFASVAPIQGSVTVGSISFAGVVAPKVSVSVNVPAVAAGQVGYVDVSLAATKLAGFLPAGSLLVANPTADLVAAGVGGGFVNCRINGVNTVRFAFLGPLAGGASNFLVGVI